MIDENIKKAFEKQITLYFEQAERTSQKANELFEEGHKHHNEYGLQQSENGLIYKHLTMLYRQEAASLTITYGIVQKMDKLPDKQAVDEINKELTKKVEETLGPIAEEYERQKEREKKGGDIYQ